jgi:hypothetical protein
LDLTKAFDTVNHDILIQKLEYYGIRGLPGNWFRPYLTSRFQFVSIENTNSVLKSIINGVPQGLVLGPLLFLLFLMIFVTVLNGWIFIFLPTTQIYFELTGAYRIYNSK